MATFTLTWADTVTGETAWQIERRAMPSGSYALWQTVAAGTTSYTDTSYDGTTLYRFRVRAMIGAAGQRYSNEVSVPDQAALLPVRNARGTGQSAPAEMGLVRSPMLSWTNISDETGYSIERATGTVASHGTFAEIATVGQDVVVHADGTAVYGTSYVYQVHAFNAVGDGPDSNMVGTAV